MQLEGVRCIYINVYPPVNLKQINCNLFPGPAFYHLLQIFSRNVPLHVEYFKHFLSQTLPRFFGYEDKIIAIAVSRI